MSWRQWSSVQYAQAPPLPLHEPKPKFRCHHYAVYGMSCDDYDGLLWRSSNRCDICRRHKTELYKQRLCIDHDSRLGNGWNHVRGLLCPKCNNSMRYVDNGYRQPTTAQQHYIDTAWFWTGLPPDHLELPWLPETCESPSTALSWRHNPNRRWERAHGRYGG